MSNPHRTQQTCRIHELAHDGYIVLLANGNIILTPKGWRVLLACADRPLPPPKKEISNDRRQGA